jgi:hypothetical protein
MSKRERMLALIVGCLAVALGLYFAQSYVSGAMRQRRGQIATLERQVSGLKTQVALSRMAAGRLREYEARSLPPEPEVARSLYQGWLLEEAGEAELIDQHVRADATITEGDLYVKQAFTITGKGSLPQVVELLYAICRHDYLQRITLLSLQPIKESKLLDISITIEAMSLKAAAPATELTPRPNPRLALGTRDAYAKAILDRNLFGPPNHAPRLADPGRQRGNPNRSVEFQARASDPDSLDRIHYQLVKSADPGARFDSTSGRFTWTPRKTGEYQFVVRATDDGLPSKTDEKTITVSISDPPPPMPVAPTPPPKLAFDDAKHTVLTAVIDVSGESEVWLLIRPKGQTLRLHVGDKFEVGSIKGVVASIGQSDFTFEADGKQRKLAKGEILEQAPAIAKDG